MKRRSTVASISQGMRALLLLLALLLAFAGCNITEPPMETSPSEDASTGEDSSTREETTTLEETTVLEDEKNPVSLYWETLGDIIWFFREYQGNNHGKMFIFDTCSIEYYYCYPSFRASDCVDGVYRDPEFCASFIMSSAKYGIESKYITFHPAFVSYDLSAYTEITEAVLANATWEPWEDLPEELNGVHLVYNGIKLYGVYFQDPMPDECRDQFLKMILDMLTILEY